MTSARAWWVSLLLEAQSRTWRVACRGESASDRLRQVRRCTHGTSRACRSRGGVEASGKTHARFWIVPLVLVWSHVAAAAGIDRTVEVQGVLETSSGVPANGNFDLELRFYADGTTTTTVYTKTLSGVTVDGGVFDATVGPLPASVLALDQLWLAIGVGGDELPRRPIRATPFALVSQTAREATTVNCSKCLSTTLLADSAVTPAKVGPGSYAISISGVAESANLASEAISAQSFSGPLSGDVTGTQLATTVAAIRGKAVSSTAPQDKEILKYDAAAGQWKPGVDQAGTGTVTSVGVGPGLGGGPITGAGTLQLRLAPAGGLSVSVGDGTQLGIAPNGVTTGMVSAGTYNIAISGNAATATTAQGFSGDLAGDVTGKQGTTSVVKLQGVPVASGTPGGGQVLTYNGAASRWEAATPAQGVASLVAGTGISIGGSATSPQISVLYGTTAGTAAQGNDSRLSDARAPLPGSASYIQNQTGGNQSASFRISGNALVQGSVGIGTASPQGNLDVAGSFFFNGLRVSTIKVVAEGYLTYRPDVGVWLDGVYVKGPARSYSLVVLSRSNHAVVFTGSYDVYGDANQATNLANKMNSYDEGYILIVATHDEPLTNRLSGGLPAAINRIGGSTAKFVNGPWAYRNAYLLIGIPNSGEGNGIEMVTEHGNDSVSCVETGAWVVGGMLFR